MLLSSRVQTWKSKFGKIFLRSKMEDNKRIKIDGGIQISEEALQKSARMLPMTTKRKWFAPRLKRSSNALVAKIYHEQAKQLSRNVRPVQKYSVAFLELDLTYALMVNNAILTSLFRLIWTWSHLCLSNCLLPLLSNTMYLEVYLNELTWKNMYNIRWIVRSE